MNKTLDRVGEKAHNEYMSATPIPPTASQTSFIKVLLDDLRDNFGDDTMRALLNRAYSERTLTVQSASATIEHLIGLRDHYRTEARKSAPVVAPAPSKSVVASGHYALDIDGEIKFYEVREGSGKWAGFTFVDAVASDERHPIKNRQSREAILALIAAAPLEAMKLYGREIGACGHCGRTLTSAWRKEGIGPICSRKFA